MLLKAGYRHVYISRKFAQKHGFIPRDATPGNYGYGGLVNIGTWPITLVTSSSAGHGEASNSAHDRHDNGDNWIGEGESLLRPPARAGAIGVGIGGIGQGHGHRQGRWSPAPSHQSTSNPAPSIIVRSSSRSSTGTLPQINGTNGINANRVQHHHHHHARHQHPDQDQQQNEVRAKPTVTNIQVYLSEEPHFDVVLGRSFFEKRQIKTSSIDPTDVVCLDTGEKIECEVVILKDGKGEIVTVT